MGEFAESVISAHRTQLDARRAILDAGARHVGWKVALGLPGAEELLGEAPAFVTAVVRIAQLLLAVGEPAHGGDRIICGAICSAYPDSGDVVEVEVGELGRVAVTIT